MSKSYVLAALVLTAASWAAPLSSAQSPASPVSQPPEPSAPKLPSLGDSVAEDFGLSAERQAGLEIMRVIWRDPDYLDDAFLQDYLSQLWDPLVQSAKKLDHVGEDLQERFALQTFQVRDRSINAFALPGGWVGVHLGLVASTGSRDELASVLAHELSHVTQRHIARSIESGRNATLLGSVGMILGVLAASKAGKNGVDAANAVISGSQALMIQSQLNFSRDMEREADRIGHAILTGAGFDPQGMPRMFERLQVAAGLNDNGQYPYLRSHPLTGERIGEAQMRAAQGFHVGQAPSNRIDPKSVDWGHRLAQARARVLAEPTVDAWRLSQARDQLPPNGDNPGEAFSAWAQSAMASIRLRDGARAERALAFIDKTYRPHIQDEFTLQGLALVRGEWWAAQGQADKALAGLEAWPLERSRALTLHAAQWALHPAVSADRAQRVQLALRMHLHGHPKDASAWHALSLLAAQQGQALQAIRADAESRYAQQDLVGAMDRLRAGQALIREQPQLDHVEASIIDARMRAWHAEWVAEREAHRRGRTRGADEGV